MGVSTANWKTWSARQTFEPSRSVVVTTVNAIAEVIADDTTSGPLGVLAAAGLPAIGDAYSVFGESDGSLFCVSKTPEQDAENRLLWRVICEFSNDAGTAVGGGGVVVNPLARPVVITYSGATEQSTTLFDADGNPLVNVIGEYFEPQAVENAVATIRFSRNEPTINTLAIQYYTNAVNNDTFYGFPLTTLRMLAISAEGPLIEDDTTYFPHTYEMAYRRSGWRRPLLNIGRSYLDPDDSTIKSIEYDHALLVNAVQDGRWPLTSSGGVIDPASWTPANFVYLGGGGVIVPNPASTGPPYDGARFYSELPFAALGL